MRYIANSDGYLQQVSFGADIACNGQACTEYTGAVPTDYKSLEDWYCQETEKMYRWKIVDGELVIDPDALPPLDKDTSSGTGTLTLPIASSTSLGGIKVGENLSIAADGTLSVLTADEAQEDNTKPMTSAGVYTQLGNIEVLLAAL